MLFVDNVLTCIQCGNLFKGFNRPVCITCKVEEDKVVAEIRKFLRKDPDASASELCDAVGCSISLLSRLIDEGRVVMKQNKSPLSCQICSKKIPRGKICSTCAAQLSSGIDSNVKTSEKSHQKVTTRYFNKNR